ncbi:unnamed protein product [Caenorhabditis brenneri]
MQFSLHSTMLPILCFLLILDISGASQIFSETVGQVTITQNTCSVVPHRVWKRFTATGPKPTLQEYSPETIKFLMQWMHSAHGVESRLENMLLKWDEQSICFDRPTKMPLKKVLHGGAFSNDFKKFSYLEVPEHWIAPKEDDLEGWRNIKLEECTTTADNTYRCPESAVVELCSQKDLEKCSERIEMDSSAEFFTFSRRLGPSHVVATRARYGSIIRGGNIFDLTPMSFPERIFKITLRPDDLVAIGTEIVKN